MQTVAQLCACFRSFQKGMSASGCSQTLTKMDMCLSSMVTKSFRKVPLLVETICQLFTLFRCEGAVITSSTYSSHIALHTSLTTIEGFHSDRQEYYMPEYLAPESRWHRVATSYLRLGSKGFLFQVCCSEKRLRTFQLDF